jgi:hypothetical protein
MTKLHNTNKVQCHKVWQNYTIQIKEYKGNEMKKKIIRKKKIPYLYLRRDM